MLDKLATTDTGKFSQYFPSIATIVTCHHDGKDNALAVAWHMPISSNPPLYGVAIGTGRLSYDMISASGEFVINFMPFSQAELVAATGGLSGKKIDKFTSYRITSQKAIKTSVPVLASAYAAFECKVADIQEYGDHVLFVGHIVALHQAQQAYDAKGLLDIENIKPVLYLGSDHYLEIVTSGIKLLERGLMSKKLQGENVS